MAQEFESEKVLNSSSDMSLAFTVFNHYGHLHHYFPYHQYFVYFVLSFRPPISLFHSFSVPGYCF